MKFPDYKLQGIYENVVQAVTSYLLRRRWYPNNNERGYIERSYKEERKPDELVQEFVKQYGEGNLTPDAVDDGDAEAKSEAFAQVVKMVGNKGSGKPRRR